MIWSVLVILIVLLAQRTIVGFTVVGIDDKVYEPKVMDFERFEDAMEYAELRQTGWRGTVRDFYEWKEEE